MERTLGQYEKMPDQLDSKALEFREQVGVGKVCLTGNSFLPFIYVGSPKDDSQENSVNSMGICFF